MFRSLPRLTLLALCLSGMLGGPAYAAEPEKTSDALWCLDGSNIQSADRQGTFVWWQSGNRVHVRPVTEGKPDGFILENTTNLNATSMYINVDPAYPWLVWEVTDVQQVRGYIGFGIRMDFPAGTPMYLTMSQVGQIQTGIFAVDYSRQIGQKPARRSLRLDLSGATMTLSYMKMVARPENLVTLESPAFEAKQQLDPGDELTFRVTLAKPAKDVTIQCFHGYIMPAVLVNGLQELQLLPVDKKDPRVWTVTMKVDQMTSGALKPGKQFDVGAVMVKARVLGGELKLPLWTGNPYPFAVVKWPDYVDKKSN
ncbi:MAG: hypothetical protein IT440_02005 [Phycisphaeraceae bacterium]|nr:hypothetical protein [Phycisphaeraceae bacterium]